MIDTSANLQRLRNVSSTEVDVPVSRQLSGIEVYNVQHTNAADLAKSLQALLAEGKKADDAQGEDLHHRLCPLKLAAHQRAP